MVLPGGFVGPNETVSAAATREMVEETGFDIRHLHLEQMKVYSEPERDPRGPSSVFHFWASFQATTPKPNNCKPIRMLAMPNGSILKIFQIWALIMTKSQRRGLVDCFVGFWKTLTRRIIPPPLLRSRIDDLARGARWPDISSDACNASWKKRLNHPRTLLTA